MTYSTQECEAALTKARVTLLARPSSAFFSTLAMGLPFSFCPKTPTAYTTGKKVVLGTDFFMGLSSEARIFLILHEVMHVALLHVDPKRIATRNKKKWNVAADYVINLALVQNGFEMPPMGLLNHAYTDMSTEQVYDSLPEEDTSEPDHDDLQPEESSESFSEELTRDVQEILVRAAIQSKQNNDKPGTIPGEIEILLDKLLNPKLPWQTIIRRWFTAFSKNDYSFRKPNRRYFPQHILPSLYSPSLGEGAVFVDSSGSVSDEAFNQIISEIQTILHQLKPPSIQVGLFDHGLRSVTKVRYITELKNITFTGRGGTYITPVMEWAKKNKPQYLLVFSDGEFGISQNEDPGMPVLWVIYDNPYFQAPFGKVVNFQL